MDLILSLMTALIDFDFCDPKWCSKTCDLISYAQDYRWRGGGREQGGGRRQSRRTGKHERWGRHAGDAAWKLSHRIRGTVRRVAMSPVFCSQFRPSLVNIQRWQSRRRLTQDLPWVLLPGAGSEGAEG